MKIDPLTPVAATLRELGERLARVRKQQGVSQQSLAKAAGVGIATLRRIEDGKDGMLGSWLRLLQALHLDAAIDQLLPADFRSPMAEAAPRRRRRAPKSPPPKPGQPTRPFRWGDEKP